MLSACGLRIQRTFEEPPIPSLSFIITRLMRYRWTAIGTALAVGITLYMTIPGDNISKAARVADAENANTRMKLQEVGQTNAFRLKQDIERLQNDLRQKSQKLADFREQNTIELDQTDRIPLRLQETRSTLEKLDTERSLLDTRRDQLQIRLTEIQKREPIAPSVAQQRVTALTESLAALHQQYPEGHPDITAIERLLEKATKDAGSEAKAKQPTIIEDSAVTAQLEEQISIVIRQLAQIEGRKETVQQSARDLQAVLDRQPEVQRELDRIETSFDLLSEDLIQQEERLTKLNLIKMAVADPFEPVAPPTMPLTSRRLVLYLGIGLASLAAGIGAALLRHRLSGPISTLADLQNTYDVPVLGSVSPIGGAMRRSDPPPDQRAGETDSRAFTLDAPQMQKTGLVTPDEDQAPLNVEIRQIRRHLMRRMSAPSSAGATGDRRGREHVIVVTSADAGEGKSLMAVNLALSFVLEEGLKVLLIDADADADPPALSTLIGARAGAGLTDLLSHMPPHLSVVLQYERTLPLSFLPAGNAEAPVADVFRNQRFLALIRNIAARYRDRVVIIAAPPLPASETPPILNQHIGQTIVVIDAEITTRKALEDTLGRWKGRDNINLVLHNAG